MSATKTIAIFVVFVLAAVAGWQWFIATTIKTDRQFIYDCNVLVYCVRHLARLSSNKMMMVSDEDGRCPASVDECVGYEIFSGREINLNAPTKRRHHVGEYGIIKINENKWPLKNSKRKFGYIDAAFDLSPLVPANNHQGNSQQSNDAGKNRDRIVVPPFPPIFGSFFIACMGVVGGFFLLILGGNVYDAGRHIAGCIIFCFSVLWMFLGISDLLFNGFILRFVANHFY